MGRSGAGGGLNAAPKSYSENNSDRPASQTCHDFVTLQTASEADSAAASCRPAYRRRKRTACRLNGAGRRNKKSGKTYPPAGVNNLSETSP